MKTNQSPIEILRTVFGYESFRHHQSEIIDALIAGNDVLTLMPTGGGKSICYQIPSLIRNGTGIIVSPLIALMQDQVDALRQLDINAAYLNSSLDANEQRDIERKLRAGELELLYIAPERLLSSYTINLLKSIDIALFAIDEAHCVSQWGHDFRKEYQQLFLLHEHFPSVPRIALTATADNRTRHEIKDQLKLHNAKVFVNSFDRPNIRYKLSAGKNSRNELWKFLSTEHPDDAGIVYCLSRNKVDATAAWLNSQGRTALAYHAGMSDEERKINQARFLREDGLIMVATIAFGMGIDKPDVRFVAHLNLPKSIEAYYQETGRAGRDGKPSNAWMAYQLQDVIFLRQMMQASDANEQYKRISSHKLDAMLALCEMTSCRRRALLEYFDETSDKDCGNCDNCLQPPETVDGTEQAQKALSCVYRSGQLFGTNYLIDMLLGKKNERLLRNGHDKLSTYGIGKELSADAWRHLFRQLIAQGYLSVDIDGHGSLKLSEKCRGILRKETQFQMRQFTKAEAEEKTKRSKAPSKELNTWDMELFNALRELRGQLAKSQNVPPYVIFHDASLQAMATQRPANSNEFQYIHGVGEQKLVRYGDTFLEVIRSHKLPDLLNHSLSDTIKQTLYLYSQSKTIDEICQERDLSTSTVYSHFAEAIKAGLLDAMDIIPIEEDDYNYILNSVELMEDSEKTKLKTVYQALDEQYDYNVLKCVLAGV